jgi:hypothetical protein
LKAEKNWHQNSGAKRRVVISVRNIVVSPGSGHDCLPTAKASNPRFARCSN